MAKRLNTAILIMGFSGLAAQMLLLRELLIVFSGNEFSIGLILANWLLCEAIGSFFFGKKAENIRQKIETFAWITVVFSLSLFGAVYLIRILKNILNLSPGQSVGILPILFSSFLILFPVSASHGALFTFSCKIRSLFSGSGSFSAGKVYAYETIGTVIGGIIWTFLFIRYLNSFQTITILAVLNFFIAAVLLISSGARGRLGKSGVIITGFFFFFSIWFFFSGTSKLHHFSVKSQWRNQNVVHYQNSIYGNICVTESGGQYTFFLDGQVHKIIPVPDVVFIEEFVHLPLFSHPQPKKILILSGGSGGVIEEVLKHSSVERIDYTELDPLILELVGKFSTEVTEKELTDKRVKVKPVDGRFFIKASDRKYDVIFIGLPGPADLQTNRFFTEEFFSLARRRLGKNGILVFRLPGSLSYFNQELRDLNKCIFNTAKKVFSQVRAVPGEGNNIFLASDSKDIFLIREEEINKRLSQRGIKADAAIPRNIGDKLHPGWGNWFLRFLEGGTDKINRDFRPLAVFYSIGHWNAVFTPYFAGIFRWWERVAFWLFSFLLFAVILIALIVKKKKRKLKNGIPFCVTTTGFSGMMLDLALIFTFQAIYGYVFAWIGMLIGFFMAGAAAGAMALTNFLARIKNDKRFFIQIDLAIIGLSLLLPVIFFTLPLYQEGFAGSVLLKAVFLIFSVVSGFLVGSQFPLANKIYLKGDANLSRTAGLIYGADLLGGWLGGIIGGVFLLPVLGLAGSCWVIVLVKALSLCTVAIEPKQGKGLRK